MIIDGRKINCSKVFGVINPFTRTNVGSVPIASQKCVEEALRLSYEAKPKLSSGDRSRILRGVSNTLIKNKMTLAELITSESGLCIKDTTHEIDRVASAAYLAAKVAENIEKDSTKNYLINSHEGKPKLQVIMEPFDLVVGITPFNHPMNQAAHKVFPAVAAGACIVLKPSAKTPLSAIKLAEILLDAGLEKNMFNVVTGQSSRIIANQMITWPMVDLVTFTGGLETGLYIRKKMSISATSLAKYVAELGGCSSLIICDDADIERSVNVALRGCFENSGQRCTAIRRIIVVKKIADKFVDAFLGRAEKIRYGNPYDWDIDMGTVITEDAAKKIENRVNQAVEEGAKLLMGNKRKGALFSPTILDNVNIRSDLVCKETFGPVGAVLRAEDVEDAVRLAKMTNYGLAGAVMTKSERIAKKISDTLLVGQFSWNGIPGYRTESAPFGGFRDSGNGEKEGIILGTYGMRRIRTFYEH